MFTYESIAKFIDNCLTYATKFPGNATAYKHQAFGALRFVSESCWESQPELEAKLIRMWDEVWKPLFEYVEYG